MNPEYEEILDWIPGATQAGSSKSAGYPSQKRSKSKSGGRGGPPAIEGLVLSDGSENGEGDDYVDMKSFVPPPKQTFTVTADRCKLFEMTLAPREI